MGTLDVGEVAASRFLFFLLWSIVEAEEIGEK